MIHENLQTIYRHGTPYGIRDKSGYLFFFVKITKVSGQEQRYQDELKEQRELAAFLQAALAERGVEQ